MKTIGPLMAPSCNTETVNFTSFGLDGQRLTQASLKTSTSLLCLILKPSPGPESLSTNPLTTGNPRAPPCSKDLNYFTIKGGPLSFTPALEVGLEITNLGSWALTICVIHWFPKIGGDTINPCSGGMMLKACMALVMLRSPHLKVYQISSTSYGFGLAIIYIYYLSTDGSEPWIVYHAMEHPDGGWGNRTARIEKFGWNPDNSPAFPRPHGFQTILQTPIGE